MHKLRHFYYQNKEQIWKVVLIIAFLLGIIYYINYAISNENVQTNTNTKNEEAIYSDEQNKTYISNKSAISGNPVIKEEAQEVNNSISKFLQYCKNGNSEAAYNMLSADCKQSEYNTLEKFQERYLKSKFNKDDTYEIEQWIRNTYKVTISQDMLATGNLNSSKKVEYITIVEEDSQNKLNINGYIGKKEINKETTINQVKITVLSKKAYMDYEIYDFNIENLSSKTIKLDSLEKTGTMYLENSNGTNYNAYAHEISDEQLEIKSKHIYNLNIKYANVYSDKVTIEKIVFNNLILDYPKYKMVENKSEFEEICQFVIKL